MKAKAFIFDLNGTVIDDMHYHAEAWFDILNNDLKAGLSWEQVKEQMYGKNDEVLARLFGEGHFTRQRADELSIEKERRYQQNYRPHLSLMPGLQEFLDAAKSAGIALAIGSAAIPFNIDFVLDNLNLRSYFDVVISADDVSISKPHPETFLLCADALRVAPEDCVVFEDAPKGVEAALNAGMAAFVLTTTHTHKDFEKYGNVTGYAKDYVGLVVTKF